MNKRWLSISVILIFLVIVMILVTLTFNQQHYLRPYFIVVLLTSKPILSGNYIKNPDILHNASGFLSPTSDIPNILLPSSSDWKGTAFVGYSINSLKGRNGIAIIHPIDTKTSRFIEQETYLPQGKYKLVFGIANVADMFPPEVRQAGIGGFVGDCSDVGMKVIVTDLEKGKNYIVFDKIIRNGGWYDYSADLSSYFSNKRIKVRIESYAADKGCGLWNGEWAAVDYIDIQPY